MRTFARREDTALRLAGHAERGGGSVPLHLFVQALLVVHDLLNALVSPTERAADGEGDEAEAEAEEVAAVAG